MFVGQDESLGHWRPFVDVAEFPHILLDKVAGFLFHRIRNFQVFDSLATAALFGQKVICQLKVKKKKITKLQS